MKYKVNFIGAQNAQGLGNVGETGVAMWYESKAHVLSTATLPNVATVDLDI